MRPIPCLALFSVVSACTLFFPSVVRAEAKNPPKGEFNLNSYPLKKGCITSTTDSDCYADENAVRASGFSHFDGSIYPVVTPTSEIPELIQIKQNDVSQTLWQRLKGTDFKMHVIDNSKLPDANSYASDTFTDEHFNSWRRFDNNKGGKKWYVKMAHQFDSESIEEGPLWGCVTIGSCVSPAGSKPELPNVGVGGSTIFFAPILAETAPQATKDKVNLRDWLLARPNEYDLTKPETVNARANFFVGGRGIGFDSTDKKEKSKKAFWNHVALVWVDPGQLYRPAQNWNIKDPNFATVKNHLDDPTGEKPTIKWCINQFENVVNPSLNKKCVMAADQTQGNLFDDFRDYYISYYYAGSNSGDTDNFFPFPFTGLGVTYDPYYQAQLEAASTKDELALILPKLIGTSEFIYAIPEKGLSDTALMYLDEVYPIINTVPGPLPILGVGASFAFTRRLRRRIRQGGRVSPQR